MPGHILALDQGTTSSRAIVFDDQGQPLVIQQREFKQHYPQPCWIEHDAMDIWRTQREVLLAALAEAKLTANDIAAIGVTNQRETTVLWDRQTGEPLHRAIVWQDRRTAQAIASLERAGHGAMIRSKTGLVLDPYFSASKLAWLLDHVDGARPRAQRGELCFGTIDTWLIWRLTAGRVHATDVSNASRTMLFNIHDQRWDDELLELFNIPAAVLPEVRPSSGAFGETAIDEFKGVPITGVAGDQQAALFGQLCNRSGMIKTTYGTGCFMLMNTGENAVVSHNNLLTTVAWNRDKKLQYAVEGSVFIGGAVVQWLRDELGLIETAAEVNELAASVDDNGGVYFVPAFAGLGAPHWDASARGGIFGLTRGASRGHLARAALEAIAFQVVDLVAAMRDDTGLDIPEMRVDGGASASDLLMQFQADLLRTPVVRPKVIETTALGAAYLAGLAAGVWPDEKALESQWQLDRRFDPQMSDAEVQRLRHNWRQAVERSKDWISNTQENPSEKGSA